MLRCYSHLFEIHDGFIAASANEPVSAESEVFVYDGWETFSSVLRPNANERAAASKCSLIKTEAHMKRSKK